MTRKRPLKIRKGLIFPKIIRNRNIASLADRMPEPQATGPDSGRDQQNLIRLIADSDQDLRVSLMNDFAFKHVFHNKKALTGLLSALLEIPPETIVDLELLDTFQTGSYKKDKTGILDIKIHLNNSQKINIELQVRLQDCWKERSLFYLCRMYTADIASGEDYSVLESCIHISIIDFIMPELTRLYSVIRLIEENTQKVYSDKLSLRVLYLKKLENADEAERQSEVYKWAKLITAEDWEVLWDMAKEDEYKAEAVREMEKINTDRALRYEYISREIARMDAIAYEKDLERFRTGQEKLLAEQEALRARQETLRTEQEALQARQEELRSGQEALRAEQEALQTEQEALQTEQEALQTEQEALQTERDVLKLEEKELRSGQEELRRREEEMKRREEDMHHIQLKLQLATHMMAAGESELFLRLDSEPELFLQKVREYHLEP